MTPFQEFRMWARRAPVRERATASGVAAVVLALLVWVLIPGSGTPAASAGGSTTIPTGTGGPPSPAPPRGSCVNPSGSVPGVTAKQIKIAVILVQLSGAATNSQFGILPVGQQKDAFAKVIASINKAGGADCRQLVPQYFIGNGADQASLQQTCLSITQAGVFAAVDSGAYAQFPVVDCFPQHHVPYFGGYLLPNSQMSKFFPYLFELNSLDVVYHDTVVALSERGVFKPANGFTKLGIVYHDCYPELKTEELGWLAKVGVPASKVVTYDVGCPAAFGNSVDIEQAILKFKHAGVSNVTTLNFIQDFPTFTKIAQQQGFKPTYDLPDDSLITTSYGSSAPDYANIANAIAVTAGREGEERTPTLKPTAATLRCNSIIGRDVYKLPAAAGNVCDQMWMFAAAVDHAPTLAPASLAAGLKAARAVDFSFPEGPNDFGGNDVTYAGQFYRVAQFKETCKCWQLVEPTFHRGD